MPDLDSLLNDNRHARLLPTPGSKNERALTSILLATMTVARPFACRLLKSWGVSMGKTSKLQAYTEVTFPMSGRKSNVRPDGVLVLSTRKRRWTALVEAKANNNVIDEEQIERYGQIARTYGIDAVITLSNQLVSLPSHVPYTVPRGLGRHISFVHSSWIGMLTEARLILAGENEVDPEQRYIMEEMVEYFGHRKSGVQPFDQMSAEWRPLVVGLRNGHRFKSSTPEVESTIASWHQEARDICLILSRSMGERVELRLSRKHKADPALRLREDCGALAASWEMRCAVGVPKTVSPIEVVVNLERRTVSCGMRVGARPDRTTATGRVNALVRQLRAKEEPQAHGREVILRAFRPGKASPVQASLADVRKDSGRLVGERRGVPTSFEVLMVKDMAGRFSSRRKFVEDLEKLIKVFYERVGQRMRAWQEVPPRIAKEEPPPDGGQVEKAEEV